MDRLGFTLIELLIAIAIIGILASVMLPGLIGARKRAYDTGAQSCAKSIQTAQATWQVDRNIYAFRGQLIGYDGISVQCSDANMNVTEVTLPSASNYSISVGDIRGSKTFTVEPSRVTFINTPPTASLPL